MGGDLLRAAALVLGTSVAMPAGGQPPPPAFAPSEEAPEQFPEGPGREEAFYACTPCHNFKLVAAQGQTRAQWQDTLAWMITRHGMPALPEAEQERVLDYLAQVFPPRAPTRPGGWRNPFAPE